MQRSQPLFEFLSVHHPLTVTSRRCFNLSTVQRPASDIASLPQSFHCAAVSVSFVRLVSDLIDTARRHVRCFRCRQIR
jgi:hypothetical protein